MSHSKSKKESHARFKELREWEAREQEALRRYHLDSIIAALVFALTSAALLLALDALSVPHATTIWLIVTLLGLGGYLVYLKRYA